jgi:hypothetical protein
MKTQPRPTKKEEIKPGTLFGTWAFARKAGHDRQGHVIAEFQCRCDRKLTARLSDVKRGKKVCDCTKPRLVSTVTTSYVKGKTITECGGTESEVQEYFAKLRQEEKDRARQEQAEIDSLTKQINDAFNEAWC